MQTKFLDIFIHDKIKIKFGNYFDLFPVWEIFDAIAENGSCGERGETKGH